MDLYSHRIVWHSSAFIKIQLFDKDGNTRS